MRAEGAPSASAVASAIFSGAATTSRASANQRSNCCSGSAARSRRRSSIDSAELRAQVGRADQLVPELVIGGHELAHDTQHERGLVAERAQDLVALQECLPARARMDGEISFGV